MKRTFYSLYLKRFLDFTLALIAIFILSPIFFLLIILQIIFNGFPIFFIQKRHGENGKIFNIYKFRTMKKSNIVLHSLKGDLNRTTRFGNFLRKTSLDELPELINIFFGDMSFVGPRPVLLIDYHFMNDENKKRYLVKPGLTGLAKEMVEIV